jgi:hypothetical protein
MQGVYFYDGQSRSPNIVPQFGEKAHGVMEHLTVTAQSQAVAEKSSLTHYGQIAHSAGVSSDLRMTEKHFVKPHGCTTQLDILEPMKFGERMKDQIIKSLIGKIWNLDYTLMKDHGPNTVLGESIRLGLHIINFILFDMSNKVLSST